jgi:hypothetical protein
MEQVREGTVRVMVWFAQTVAMSFRTESETR